ncbi:MAG: bifunctional phosphopantothenoylcysteine decarboxylase/phosphopantothenate--cysteine ligase CoaBC [Deltaproteobacteria bacterium]|nr:bifunctional phosphopantothenoylcysteine decarboxylase/phosphopantothenate--cysteine ligase CoaBC [Deltaproteobacteria bacterium]
MSITSGKNIIVGVTGGIAAYKSCELVRGLIKKQASVQVVMTKNATEFITPLTLQTLSGKKVAINTFDLQWESEIGHISLADSADLIVVAPATASFIGKVASGIADSLLSTVILATKAPIILCPAMNVNMYENPVVKDNIEKLKERGFIIMEPGEGNLACGWEGKGRLPEIEDILAEIEKTLTPHDMSNEKVLVTAGATREYIDSVRYISNPSSGKMGYSLAREALNRGADVVLISGRTNLSPIPGVKTINVDSSEDMYKSVMEILDWSTIVIKAAAVGDYTLTSTRNRKIKKDDKDKILKLKRTKDILHDIGKKKSGKIVIGFAAETDNLIKNAQDKLKRKNADLIVANDISQLGAGFEGDTNIAHLVYGKNCIDELPMMPKSVLAQKIFDKIYEIKIGRRPH